MRGAGLRRYVPDPQSGGGFIPESVRGIVKATIAGAQSDKKALEAAKRVIANGISAGRAATSRAVKRKAQTALAGKAKKALRDIFS